MPSSDAASVGPADGVRVSAGSDHRTSGASNTPSAARVLNVPDLQDEIVTSLVYVFGEYDEEALGAVADAAQPQDGWLPLMIREYLNVWRESGERP